MESSQNKENTKMSGSKIKFYKNFEELKEEEAKYIQSTDLLTRVKNTMDLIRRVYGDRPLSTDLSKRITFKTITL